jgi:hypothetical protein
VAAASAISKKVSRSSAEHPEVRGIAWNGLYMAGQLQDPRAVDRGRQRYLSGYSRTTARPGQRRHVGRIRRFANRGPGVRVPLTPPGKLSDKDHLRSGRATGRIMRACGPRPGTAGQS